MKSESVYARRGGRGRRGETIAVVTVIMEVIATVVLRQGRAKIDTSGAGTGATLEMAAETTGGTEVTLLITTGEHDTADTTAQDTATKIVTGGQIITMMKSDRGGETRVTESIALPNATEPTDDEQEPNSHADQSLHISKLQDDVRLRRDICCQNTYLNARFCLSVRSFWSSSMCIFKDSSEARSS